MRQGEWSLKTMEHSVGCRGRGTSTGQWRYLRREEDLPGEEEKIAGGDRGQRRNAEGGFLKSPRCFSNVPLPSKLDVRDSSCLAHCRNLRSGASEAEIQTRKYESVPLRLPSLRRHEASVCAPGCLRFIPKSEGAEPTKQRFPSSLLSAELFLVLLR